MRAGRLRDKVSIQTRSTTADAFGGLVDTWTEDATRSCSIEPVNGKEYFAAQGEQTAASVRIRFRYEAGLLSPAKRLVDNRVSPAVIYDIVAPIIDPGNEHGELIAMCEVRSSG
jgi:SPP1 family predicted phage head-tail adaptor